MKEWLLVSASNMMSCFRQTFRECTLLGSDIKHTHLHPRLPKRSIQTITILKKKKKKGRRSTKSLLHLLRVLLSAQSGGLPLSTQRDRLVRTLTLHVHVHQVGPRRRAAAVRRAQRAVAAAARRRAQCLGEGAQLPGVGSDPGRGRPGPGGELQRFGPLQGADEAVGVRVGHRGCRGFASMWDGVDGGGVWEAGDDPTILSSWWRQM